MLGLPPDDDEDDDNHLCIKCNATIIGLDNYVQHRKTVCSKEKTDKLSQNHQGADVFFQSLNLQSSAKKPTVTVQTPPVVNKAGPGVLTRRTVAAIISGTKDAHPSSSSDLFLSQKRGEEWIGGQNIHVAENDDNHTKLIKAVASISGKVKKEYIQPTFSVPAEYDEYNEDSDDYDDFDDEDHIQTGGKWKPPVATTGGKWKPHYSRETPSPRPDPDHHDDWGDEHTGGKWKDFLSQPVESFSRCKIPDLPDLEDEVDAYRPPPGHTRGKWIPGANNEYKSDHKTQIMDVTSFHKEGGSLQFWCGPCNRKLSSRKNYEKHLASSLHLKKTLPEKDLEFSGSLKYDQRIELGKRQSKPSRYMNESIYLVTKKKTTKENRRESIHDSKKKKRRKRKVICVACKSNVKYTLMGKHLISHYHFRKADTTDDAYKSQILDNIENIVLQSPFQCSPCKFYCNWESEFLRHWKSKQHQDVVSNMEGRYWCSICKYEEDDPDAFEEHLNGQDHQEFVAAINRSMPVIIRKKTVIRCDICNEQFKYNIQLGNHINRECFSNLDSTASDIYQGKKKCSTCMQSFKSVLSLTAHMNRVHGLKKFICTRCNEEFLTSQEAKAHRRSQNHIITKLESQVREGKIVKDLTKLCPHCSAPRFANIIFLKRHIEEEHEDKFYSCFRCGMKFPLPQEVTWHIRNGQCNYNSNSSDHKWHCNYCPFVTNSAAECWYHNLILHENTKILVSPSIHGDNPRYTCPMCSRPFDKDYLRVHLRSHTGERMYQCLQCSSKFFRKSALRYHIKSCHSKDVKNVIKSEVMIETSKSEKVFSCSYCGAGFAKRSSLKHHRTTHLGRPYTCPVEGCNYTGRYTADVRIHMASHNTTRPFHCAQCLYSAKTKCQLSKHMKSHEKDREMKFVCPHCPFKSDIKSRLEKHSFQHSQEMPYKCPHCPFTCKSFFVGGSVVYNPGDQFRISHCECLMRHRRTYENISSREINIKENLYTNASIVEGSLQITPKI